jgi:hypothetical protein
MLIRNLRRAGDFQRAVLSQEENLKLAIANDKNVAQARTLVSRGQLPALSRDQQRSKEEELTDAITIQAKAQENLLSIFSKEQVAKFMEGLTVDSMTYLNVYWNDLKPIYQTKIGLSKLFFDRILKKHIDGIVDSRGMSTVPSSGTRSVSLNELAELKRLGFDWMMTDPLLRGINSKLQRIASVTAEGSRPRQVLQALELFRSLLPTQAILNKASSLPEGKRGEWFNRLINVFGGTNPDKSAWESVFDMDGREFLSGVEKLYPTLGIQREEIQKLYTFDSAAKPFVIAKPVTSSELQDFVKKSKVEKAQFMKDLVESDPSIVINIGGFQKTLSPTKGKPSTSFTQFTVKQLDDAYEKFLTGE